ncbi:MAG TPA: hypothetical protein VMU83_22715 [Hanamia sp.]|nr:hypothetical protein [Hanamia sp.]
MKKYMRLSVSIFSLVFVAIFLNSCVKDDCKSTYTYTYYIPVYETVTQLKANIKSSSPEAIENPGKIVILGNYIFLNEIEKGIHIIDDRNPASPQNVAFINIPGNMDLALKGNTLYADSYSDLVTLEISDPLNVILKNYSENALSFPYYSSGIDYNAVNKISGWIKKDTTINQNCAGGGGPIYNTGVYTFSSVQNSSVPAANSSGQVGKSGSMARFALVNN